MAPAPYDTPVHRSRSRVAVTRRVPVPASTLASTADALVRATLPHHVDLDPVWRRASVGLLDGWTTTAHVRPARRRRTFRPREATLLVSVTPWSSTTAELEVSTATAPECSRREPESSRVWAVLHAVADALASAMRP